MPLSDLFDLAVIGSGFGGSLLAMIARRLGKSVLLIEKGSHPRVVVGESSTPLANLMLEELTIRYDLPRLRPFTKWGSWQREYPHVACGLKRGFTFYHHDLEHPKPPDPERRDQLLVEASPRDGIADTHWYRADFDRFFVEEACRMGVEYLDRTTLSGVSFGDGRASLEGQGKRWKARLVVDATGPRGFLHHALRLPELPLPGFPETQSVYSHFSGVGKLANAQTGATPPYPVDAAAVHHVFDGGWIWVLQFNNGVSSAGVAATKSFSERYSLGEGAPAWQRLTGSIPALSRQFAHAKAERPFTFLPRVAFRSAEMVGESHAMLPSAAGFVDPLLSTGFPLTLAGVSRLADVMGGRNSLGWYARETEADLLAAARLIGALYANMADFSRFTDISMLYFAAVSFSETVRRLGKPELAGSFLMRDRVPFGAESARFLESAQSCVAHDNIGALIERVNVAGLADPARRNWYPVCAEDLLKSASKLQSSPEEISALLQRSGFYPDSPRSLC